MHDLLVFDCGAIGQVMNVTATKVLVGNPINPPQLNGSSIERFFNGTYCVNDLQACGGPTASQSIICTRLICPLCAFRPQSSRAVGWTCAGWCSSAAAVARCRATSASSPGAPCWSIPGPTSTHKGECSDSLISEPCLCSGAVKQLEAKQSTALWMELAGASAPSASL